MTPKDPFSPRRLGPSKDAAIGQAVVVHGFTGSPWDVLPVAEALADRGFAARVPLLHGHDRGWRAIASARAGEWRRDVRRALEEAHAESGRPVFVAGLSMGGLLALEESAKAEVPIAGVAALAVPLDLGPVARLVAEATLRGGEALERGAVWPKWGGSDISSREPLPGAGAIPLRALVELLRIVDDTRAALARVTAPLLVVHSRRDHTAPPESAVLLAREVSSVRTRLVVLREGFHVITRDVTAARVAREVTDFALSL